MASFTTFDLDGNNISLSEEDMFMNEGEYRDCILSVFELIMTHYTSHNILFTNGNKDMDIYCHIEDIVSPISSSQNQIVPTLVLTWGPITTVVNVIMYGERPRMVATVHCIDPSWNSNSMKMLFSWKLDWEDIQEIYCKATGKKASSFSRRISKILEKFFYYYKHNLI